MFMLIVIFMFISMCLLFLCLLSFIVLFYLCLYSFIVTSGFVFVCISILILF